MQGIGRDAKFCVELLCIKDPQVDVCLKFVEWGVAALRQCDHNSLLYIKELAHLFHIM